MMNLSRERGSIWLVLILIAAAAMLMLASQIGFTSMADAWDNAFGPKVNGSWRAVSLDGQSVTSDDYLIVVKRGKVVGGYDHCNGWSFDDEGPGPNGDRMVTSTLVACPETDARIVYHILAYGPRFELVSERELRLSRRCHSGLFRRCKPDRKSAECVPV